MANAYTTSTDEHEFLKKIEEADDIRYQVGAYGGKDVENLSTAFAEHFMTVCTLERQKENSTDIQNVTIEMDAIKTEMDAMDTKMKTEMDAMDTKMKTEMDAMKTEMVAMETEMDAMKTEMDAIDTKTKTEMDAMDTKIDAMDTKIDAMEIRICETDTQIQKYMKVSFYINQYLIDHGGIAN